MVMIFCIMVCLFCGCCMARGCFWKLPFARAAVICQRKVHRRPSTPCAHALMSPAPQQVKEVIHAHAAAARPAALLHGGEIFAEQRASLFRGDEERGRSMIHLQPAVHVGSGLVSAALRICWRRRQRRSARCVISWHGGRLRRANCWRTRLPAHPDDAGLGHFVVFMMLIARHLVGVQDASSRSLLSGRRAEKTNYLAGRRRRRIFPFVHRSYRPDASRQRAAACCIAFSSIPTAFDLHHRAGF